MSVVLQRALAETLGEVLRAVRRVRLSRPLRSSPSYLATIGDADQELAQADLSERVN